MRSIVFIFALIVNTLAASPRTRSVSFFDNFDSPPSSGSPIVPALALVDGSAGGALYYNAFSYAEHNLTSATLVPNTPPYNIGSGVTAQLQEGSPGWRAQNSRLVNQNPSAQQLPRSSSTNTHGSQALHSVHSFTEHSIYYSCQVYDATGQPAVPEACTIQANGTTITGKTVTQNLVYTPAPLLVDSTFTKATFSSDFTELLNVTFSIVPEVQQALTVINFDSHTYTALLKVLTSSA